MLQTIIAFGSVNIAILFWLVDSIRRRFAEVNNRITELAEIVQTMDARLSARIDEVNIRIDATNVRIDETNQRVDELGSRLDRRIDETNKRIDDLHRDHKGMYKRLTEIEVLLPKVV